jgi:hypothetical protein
MKYRFFTCPKCNATHSAGEWNNETITLCKNRDQRRRFVRIQDAGKQARWYQCPSCKAHVNGFDAIPRHTSEVAAENKPSGYSCATCDASIYCNDCQSYINGNCKGCPQNLGHNSLRKD